MKYMLLIYTNPANWDVLSEDERNKLMGEYGAFSQQLTESGELVDGAPLADPTTARTVRLRSGGTDVTDGPFVESKEHLAGYYVVECDSPERAATLAAKIPDARFGGVEVRQLMDMSGAEM